MQCFKVLGTYMHTQHIPKGGPGATSHTCAHSFEPLGKAFFISNAKTFSKGKQPLHKKNAIVQESAQLPASYSQYYTKSCRVHTLKTWHCIHFECCCTPALHLNQHLCALGLCLQLSVTPPTYKHTSYIHMLKQMDAFKSCGHWVNTILYRNPSAALVPKELPMQHKQNIRSSRFSKQAILLTQVQS